MKTLAMVHSIQKLVEVEIVEHRNNNDVIALYKGKKYTAIFNPFVCYYYVDDLYGAIKEDEIK